MQAFTAALTTTAMLLAALSLAGLTSRSLCAARGWQSEVRRAGERLKDHPGLLRSQAACRGPRITWSFKGKLHDT